MSYDYVVRQLEKAYENGEISEQEYLENLKSIREEARERASELAQDTFNEEMGNY